MKKVVYAKFESNIKKLDYEISAMTDYMISYNRGLSLSFKIRNIEDVIKSIGYVLDSTDSVSQNANEVIAQLKKVKSNDDRLSALIKLESQIDIGRRQFDRYSSNSQLLRDILDRIDTTTYNFNSQTFQNFITEFHMNASNRKRSINDDDVEYVYKNLHGVNLATRMWIVDLTSSIQLAITSMESAFVTYLKNNLSKLPGIMLKMNKFYSIAATVLTAIL